jgi:hypothetical protein
MVMDPSGEVACVVCGTETSSIRNDDICSCGSFHCSCVNCTRAAERAGVATWNRGPDPMVWKMCPKLKEVKIAVMICRSPYEDHRF